MEEQFHVYRFQRINTGPFSTDTDPYGYKPIVQQGTGSLLPPFDSEEEAISYIENINGAFGPLVIVKTYSSNG